MLRSTPLHSVTSLRNPSPTSAFAMPSNDCLACVWLVRAALRVHCGQGQRRQAHLSPTYSCGRAAHFLHSPKRDWGLPRRHWMLRCTNNTLELICLVSAKCLYLFNNEMKPLFNVSFMLAAVFLSEFHNFVGNENFSITELEKAWNSLNHSWNSIEIQERFDGYKNVKLIDKTGSCQIHLDKACF